MSEPVAVTIIENQPVYAVVGNAPGPIGPTGPAGTASTFVYDQGVSSATWTIAHNLGKFPSVLVQDTANDEVEGDVNYVDANTVVLSFGAPFSGKAYLN